MTRLITLINDFDGGTNGATVSPYNSGGISGSPWDAYQFNSGGSNVMAYDNTQVATGNFSCKIFAPNDKNYLIWSTSMASDQPTQTQIWFRMSLFFTSIPTFNVGVFQAVNGTNTTAATVQVNATTGKISVNPVSGTGVTTTNSIPTNQWFRIEGFIIGDPTQGQVSISLYNIAGSTLVTETKTSGNVNTAGPMDSWRLGSVLAGGIGNTAQFWMDDVGISNAGYLGPTPNGFTSIRVDDGGACTQIAVQGTYPNGTLACAGDVEGFFLSTDYGVHWNISNTGLYGLDWRRLACIQYSASQSNTIYACAGIEGNGGGFLASYDGGNTWQLINSTVQYSANTTNIPGDQARSAGNLLAQFGTQDLMYTATYKDGVYRSSGTVANPNHGNSWRPIGLNSGSHFGRSIAVDPTNQDSVYVAMYNEGIYQATNASTGSPANFSLMSGSPPFPEQIVVCSSGNIYVAAGFGGSGGGGLWTNNLSGTAGWSSVDPSGTVLSSSSYWLSVDGYTDSNGFDQLIVGCNNPVQGPGGGFNNLIWVTVTPNGTARFSTLTDVKNNIQVAYVPPNTDRSWWHTATNVPHKSQAVGFKEWLGESGFFQPHATIDRSTINTSNVAIYVAAACGVFTSLGNTIGSHGPVSPMQWNLAVNQMAIYIAHNMAIDPADELHLIWATRDWGYFDIIDGCGYNASTTVQSKPNIPGFSSGGYAVAIDPQVSLCYLSMGVKGSNSHGQIWSRDVNFNWTNISTSGPPFSSTITNVGGNVAYGMLAGRDQNNNPYLLAFIQGNSTSGGIWRFSGYTISSSNVVSGGTWTKATATPSNVLGNSGNSIPPGLQAPMVFDPINAGVVYCFDQQSGLWRSTNYGRAWTQLWAITNNDARTGYLASHPLNSGELWLCYQGPGSAGGLFKITNANTISSVITVGGGKNTFQINGIALPGAMCFAPNGDIYCLSLGGAAPLSPNTALMGSFDDGNTWFHADNGTLASSASFPSDVVFAPNGRIYIANNANILAYGYPVQPVQTGQALLSVTPALTATGEDVTSGNKTGSAVLHVTPTLTPSTGGVVQLGFANLSIQPTITTSGGDATFIVQQVSGSSSIDYGLSSVEINTTTGNTLVVLAGWTLNTNPILSFGAGATATMPAAYVTDSAGNYWYHVATSSTNNTGSRCSAWICPNASAISWLSVSLTTFASSLAYTVIEVSGMPPFYSLDVVDAQGIFASTNITVNPGSTSDVDFAFAVFATGGATGGPTITAGWNALTSVSSVPVFVSNPNVGANATTIYPYYRIPAAGTNLNTNFRIFGLVPLSGIVFAVHNTVAPPMQLNSNFPVLKIEAGFGFTPGDPSQPPPTWTDITNRCVSSQGDTWITVGMGRQYELAVAEAGQIQIVIDNHDGAFTPNNPSSPYYPNVVLGTPIRISAFWNGSWFYVGFGYVERWPQEWPDLPQWGLSKMIATDAISIMAAVAMSDAADSEMLLDVPYLLLPANEQYTTFSNGIDAFFSSADPQGLLAQNISRINQRPGVYVDGVISGVGIIAGLTGATTNMLGTSNTGFGVGSFQSAPTGPASTPGIVYTDPNIPNPTDTNGVTVSFWVIIPTTVPTANLQPVVFRAFSFPSNYAATRSAFTVQINNLTGSNSLTVTLADNTQITAFFSVSNNPQLITITILATFLNIFINGSLATAATIVPTAAQVPEWNAVSLGCPNYAYQSSGIGTGNFTAFSLAIYPYVLPIERIVSQYNTGIFGQQNVDATTRVAQLLSWSNLGIPRAGRTTFNGVPDGVLQGPAYNLSGANVSDAVNQIALNHNGMVAAMPSGSLVYFHKWALFNQTPAAVFGDNVDPAQGEIPSTQQTAFSYDNTFVYNIVQVTQQYGANNQLSVTIANFASQHSYFTRSALSETITTMSNLDVYDTANWQSNKYAQPSLRLSELLIDASSNPQAAFPVVLGLQQGDVVTVIRRPVGGAVITQNVLIQQITHNIGPSLWQTSYQMSPYTPEGNVLQLDAAGFDILGSNTLP